MPGSEPSTASNLLLRKSLDISSDIIPEKMLEASQLNAIDTTSKGVDSPEGVVYAPGRIGMRVLPFCSADVVKRRKRN